MLEQRPQIIGLLGETASGKTELALMLAERYPIDIISVDSVMIYRGMNIGSAKPDSETLARVPHYLIDICDPRDSYSVGAFYRDAISQIEQSLQRGRIPLLVGGTMMYFRALREGLATLPQADIAFRHALSERLSLEGLAALHRELAAVDAEAAARIHPNDFKRLQRALEVFTLTGKPLSAWLKESQEHVPYHFHWCVLQTHDPASLRVRIAARFLQMLQAGLIEEVKALMALPGMHGGLPSMRSVNYHECLAYMRGQYSYDEMIAKAVVATSRLAKHQRTWLRSFRGYTVLDGGLNAACARMAQFF